MAVARSYSGTGRTGCTGAWRYSFTSTVTQLNGKESRGERAWASARAWTSVSACVCVEMQNGHGTPQGEVYREALLHFPFFFMGGSVLLDDSFNFLGRTLPLRRCFLFFLSVPRSGRVGWPRFFRFRVETRDEQNGEKANATRRAAHAVCELSPFLIYPAGDRCLASPLCRPRVRLSTDSWLRFSSRT